MGAEPSPPPSTSSAGTGSAPALQPSGPAPAPVPSPPAESSGSSPDPNPPALPQDDAPAAVNGVAAADACATPGGADACGACVCSTCRSELDACLGVAGCAEILACVRDSGCSGSDCYCGDARLTECVRGEASGPCMDAVLAAPGGKAPSLNDPSGGPASDAAVRVAECAEDDDVCRDVCGLDD